ncbi:hypothetical protein CHLNCDRAFT_137944 [Chlorella variabilis]|uniref:Patatin n=1 Tax=Chlorella variabilis TaxID=554065 RepID=E1Z4W8_CHLVA|nr:hypothetical protein CHLNCDRAFT_137944 [Chlorella variabilis]EFN59130.1 hypothetical protein CHLNCDRAFT_137944 [Chlorella variabilis]|eukprot:XP_005851232.1 hypothetical protein CHLNCDRAFT_137944 [Chlorella variabilis]
MEGAPAATDVAAATGVLTPTPPEQRGEQGPAADGASQRWPLPLPIPGWFRRAESEQEEAPRAPVQVQVAAGSKQPILSFAGGGIFFWWELGCLRYLHRNFDLTKVQLVGASAGGLIATLAACGVDEDKAVRVANRLAQEYGVFERPGGLAGIWGSLIRAWLEELLPEDAAERCAGRVRLVVTEVPSLKLRYLQDFESKQDLIDANMASAFIPFFLDGKATCPYRGRSYIDGSLWDFLLSDNSDLIKCDGKACVVDYFNDDQLQWSRLDFIKLADLQQVQAFVGTGYAYAARVDAAGDCFERPLGSTRKGTVRKVLEVPVWGLRRALASVDG